MSAETWMEAHATGLALGLAAGDERNRELRLELSDSERLITSYQIAKDNLEIRLARAVLANEKPKVSVFAERWSY